MPEYNDRQKAPSWLGFHRDGLIIVLVLDLSWTFIEVAAGASIIGIPAIPFIAFSMFGLASFIIFKKQRKLGDSQKVAISKAFILGAIAGIPFSFIYWLLFGLFGILNFILPNTKGVSVKLPSHQEFSLGKFTTEFKEVESLLKKAIKQVGKQPFSEVYDNIEYLKDKGKISIDMADALHQVRKVRNKITHNTDINPDVNNLRLLKRIKEELEGIVKK